MLFSHYVDVNDGQFTMGISPAPINTWMHVAIVYKGPNDDEGITVYHDGINKGSDTAKHSYSPANATGIVKIGRRFDEPGSAQYGPVYLDELLFFNRQLNQSEIVIITSMP